MTDSGNLPWQCLLWKEVSVGVGVQHVTWDEDFFEKAFAQAWQCIQAVSAHQKPLSRFRVITESLPANEQIPGGTDPKKYGETRYGSRVTMSERSLSPCTKGEFGWRPTSSITVGHRAYHRWSRWFPENLHKTPFFSAADHLTWLNWIKHKKTQMVCTNRQTGTHFFLKKNLKQIKNYHPSKKFKKIKKMPCYQGTGLGCSVALLAGFPSKAKIHPSSQTSYNVITMYTNQKLSNKTNPSRNITLN